MFFAHPIKSGVDGMHTIPGIGRVEVTYPLLVCDDAVSSHVAMSGPKVTHVPGITSFMDM